MGSDSIFKYVGELLRDEGSNFPISFTTWVDLKNSSKDSNLLNTCGSRSGVMADINASNSRKEVQRLLNIKGESDLAII